MEASILWIAFWVVFLFVCLSRFHALWVYEFFLLSWFSLIFWLLSDDIALIGCIDILHNRLDYDLWTSNFHSTWLKVSSYTSVIRYDISNNTNSLNDINRSGSAHRHAISARPLSSGFVKILINNPIWFSPCFPADAIALILLLENIVADCALSCQ